MSTQMKDDVDVIELWGVLQCLGFNMRSVTLGDGRVNPEAGTKVVITCQYSGATVVFESGISSCSCPPLVKDHSELWQVSGVAKGKQHDKEYGCALLRTLPQPQRDKLSKDLHDIIKNIKDFNESELEKEESRINKSASFIETKNTPEKIHLKLKAETPTRYRSLDTLTSRKDDEKEELLPAPGPLQKAMPANADTSVEDLQLEEKKKEQIRRQATYSISSSSSIRRRNKTSSPINGVQNTVLEHLLGAEKTAEELVMKLSSVIKEIREEGNDNNSSISSLTLDVSKISFLKTAEPVKNQFASSPNLSKPEPERSIKRNILRGFGSASTSNLQKSVSKENKSSKLRHISPSFFKSKKYLVDKAENTKPQDTKPIKTSLFKQKIATPVCTPKLKAEPSPNLSTSSRNRYSSIKSTIPRLNPKKDNSKQ